MPTVIWWLVVVTYRCKWASIRAVFRWHAQVVSSSDAVGYLSRHWPALRPLLRILSTKTAEWRLTYSIQVHFVQYATTTILSVRLSDTRELITMVKRTSCILKLKEAALLISINTAERRGWPCKSWEVHRVTDTNNRADRWRYWQYLHFCRVLNKLRECMQSVNVFLFYIDRRQNWYNFNHCDVIFPKCSDFDEVTGEGKTAVWTRTQLLLTWPRNLAQFEFSLSNARYLSLAHYFSVISDNITTSHILPKPRFFVLHWSQTELVQLQPLWRNFSQMFRFRWSNGGGGHRYIRDGRKVQSIFWYLERFRRDSSLTDRWTDRRTHRRTDWLIAYAALHYVARAEINQGSMFKTIMMTWQNRHWS